MCGSRRRRPITSPPGGGIVARPKRASSGPGEQERGADLAAELRVELDFVDAARRATRTSFGAGPLDASAPRSASSSSIVSTSRMRGTFVQRHRLVGEQARGEDRQRAVLVAGRADAAVERARALDHEGVGDRGCDGHGGLC